MFRTYVWAVLLVVFGGCKSHKIGHVEAQKVQQVAEAGNQRATETKPAEPKKETQAVERVPSVCPHGKKVSSGDLSEVGGALFVAYSAALKGSDPDALNRFLSAFAPDVDRRHIERYIFPKVREHVKKYVNSENDPSFVICRIENQSEDRVKVFVRSNDPRKSDPPAILVRVDGKWFLEAMTP